VAEKVGEGLGAGALLLRQVQKGLEGINTARLICSTVS
jgi:hypothetical protein